MAELAKRHGHKGAESKTSGRSVLPSTDAVKEKNGDDPDDVDRLEIASVAESVETHSINAGSLYVFLHPLPQCFH